LKDLGDRYETEALQLLDDNKFLEGATKLHLAAKEYVGVDDIHQKQLSARGDFFQGMGTYFGIKFGREEAVGELHKAFDNFQTAEEKFRVIDDRQGTLASQGWKLFMEGLIEDSGGRPELAQTSYSSAKSAFGEIDSASDVVKQAILAVDNAYLSSRMNQIVLDPALREKMGTLYSVVSELKENSPGQEAFYQAQLGVLRSLEYFLEGQASLKLWDYHEGRELFDKALSELEKGKIVSPRNEIEKQMARTVEAYRELNAAGSSEAQSLELLLKDGDPRMAGQAQRQAADAYRKAEDGFVETRFSSLREFVQLGETAKHRAGVLSELGSDSLKATTIGLGKWFVLFTFTGLGLLTLLNAFLKVDGFWILVFSLFIGICGGFGLKGSALLEALGKIVSARQP